MPEYIEFNLWILVNADLSIAAHRLTWRYDKDTKKLHYDEDELKDNFQSTHFQAPKRKNEND